MGYSNASRRGDAQKEKSKATGGLCSTCYGTADGGAAEEEKKQDEGKGEEDKKDKGKKDKGKKDKGKKGKKGVYYMEYQPEPVLFCPFLGAIRRWSGVKH